jgi:hypothetical protein
VVGGDAVEGAVAQPDGAVGLVVRFVAAGGQRLAECRKDLVGVATGPGMAGRLGAELGEDGIVAGGQAELDLAVGADVVLGRPPGRRRRWLTGTPRPTTWR